MPDQTVVFSRTVTVAKKHKKPHRSAHYLGYLRSNSNIPRNYLFWVMSAPQFRKADN